MWHVTSPATLVLEPLLIIALLALQPALIILQIKHVHVCRGMLIKEPDNVLLLHATPIFVKLVLILISAQLVTLVLVEN